LYTFLISTMSTTCPTHLTTLFHHPNIWWTTYKLWRS
jgi:hypothetical protein